MSLTSVAMIGILLGFVFLVVGFLMEGPQSDSAWNKSKRMNKKAKKRVVRVGSLQRKAA